MQLRCNHLISTILLRLIECRVGLLEETLLRVILIHGSKEFCTPQLSCFVTIQQPYI
ncbi:MAG: hypothetical protein KZQ62_17310 [Candidatus Thiodiazotropha sp. (ex Lucinoma aequizonata)]|nr:hypothetical protein [Candidatus Thiodiazotropha sp. (ex Lucinoma aequizonata)]